MIRLPILCAVVWGLCVFDRAPAAQNEKGSPPLQYELVLNGETYRVEANRLVKLTSRKSPETSYTVALRVAPVQYVTLGGIRFGYEMPATLQTTVTPTEASARLNHELGFTMLIADQGGPIQREAQDRMLKILTDSALESLKDSAVGEPAVSKPDEHKFGSSLARGVVIRYRDEGQVPHNCLVLVLVGQKFTASAIVQYLDPDGEEVVPVFQKTLESIQAAPQ